jgi:hypothetical protein
MRLFNFLIVLFFCFYSSVQAADLDSGKKSFDFAQFEIGANYLTQSTYSGSGFGGIVRWTPEYHLDQNWSIGLDGGFTDFSFNNNSVDAFEYALTAKFQMNEWYLKGYIGAQTWNSTSYITALMFGPEVGYSFREPFLGCLRSVFFSYTPVFQDISTVHELTLGFEIRL